MKKFSKILAVLLTLALIFSLVACGGSKASKDDDEDTSDVSTATEEMTEAPTEETAPVEESVVGTWKYTVDFGKLLGGMDADPENAAMLELLAPLFEDLTVTMVMDLKEDDTFTMAVDEASAQDISKALEERLPALLPDLIAGMLGMTREDLEAQLAAEGHTMDELIAEASEEFDADELLDELASFNEQGTYTFEEGKLVLTSENGNVLTYTVELSGDELTVTDVEGGDMPEGMLPMVFTR